MFHNTLVVSSSPTSSTTQSPTTGESGLVKNVIVESRPGCRDSRRAYYAACSPRRLARARTRRPGLPWHEAVDLNHMSALDLDPLEFLVLDHEVLAFGDFVAATS